MKVVLVANILLFYCVVAIEIIVMKVLDMKVFGEHISNTDIGDKYE